jgi:hypothetical protein
MRNVMEPDLDNTSVARNATTWREQAVAGCYRKIADSGRQEVVIGVDGSKYSEWAIRLEPDKESPKQSSLWKSSGWRASV